MEFVSKATKVIVIARVSDGGRQQSNPAQVSRLKEFADNKGLKNPIIYEIEESSSKKDRKLFNEILKKEVIECNEVVALATDTVDRLQRSFRETPILDDLRKAGRLELYFHRENLIIHKDSNSADIIRWDMAVMFAKMYIAQLSDNVKRRFEQMRSEGMRTSKVPLGYKGEYIINEKGDKKRTNIVPDSERDYQIVETFRLFSTEKYSLSTITNEMQKRGMTGSQKNKPIGRSMVAHILSDPFYYGEMLTKGTIIPHIYQPLISRELYIKVQKILNGRKKNPTKFVAREFVLRGLIKCSNCGCVYSPEIKKGYLVYYSCTNAKNNCKRVYVREEELLEPILQILDKLYMPKEKVDDLVKALKKSAEAKNLYQTREIATLRKIYDDKQTLLDGLLDLLSSKRIDQATYDRRVDEHKKKQREVEIQLASHTNADEHFYLNAGRVMDLVRRVREIFNSSEVNEKNLFLSYLLQNATANGKNLSFTMKSPFKELLAITKHPIELGD